MSSMPTTDSRETPAQKDVLQQDKPQRIQRKLQHIPGIHNHLRNSFETRKRGRPKKNDRASQLTRTRDTVALAPRLGPTRSYSSPSSAVPPIALDASDEYVGFQGDSYERAGIIFPTSSPNPSPTPGHSTAQAPAPTRLPASPALYRQYLAVRRPSAMSSVPTSSSCATSSPVVNTTYPSHVDEANQPTEFTSLQDLPVAAAQHQLYQDDPASLNCTEDFLTRLSEDPVDLTHYLAHNQLQLVGPMCRTISEPFIPPNWNADNQVMSTGFNTEGPLPSHLEPDLVYFPEHSSNIENATMPTQQSESQSVYFDAQNPSEIYSDSRISDADSHSQVFYSSYHHQLQYGQDSRGRGPSSD